MPFTYAYSRGYLRIRDRDKDGNLDIQLPSYSKAYSIAYEGGLEKYSFPYEDRFTIGFKSTIDRDQFLIDASRVKGVTLVSKLPGGALVRVISGSYDFDFFGLTEAARNNRGGWGNTEEMA